LVPVVPAWVTVVLSLGAAIIAGAAASVTQIVTARAQRASQLYFRRIDAAAAFSASALDTLSVVRDAVREGSTVSAAKVNAVLDLLHKAEARRALVGLLFAKESDVAQGKGALDKLRVTVRRMQEVPAEEVQKLSDAAERGLDQFHEAVLEVLKRGGYDIRRGHIVGSRPQGGVHSPRGEGRES
jgi:hypothetical protein